MFYFLILLSLSLLTTNASSIKKPFNSADLASILEKMTVDTITVPALGRVASLGELYDARTDTFLHVPLLSGNTSSIVHSTHNRLSSLKYLLSSTLNDKLEFLQVEAGFKLGVLFGLFEVKGSGKFVRDKQSSSKSVKVSVANFVTTEYEKMEIAGEEGRKLIDLRVLEAIDATHVVAGIQWGGNVIISVEDYNSEEKELTSVRGDLHAKLSLSIVSLSVEGGTTVTDEDRREYSQFNFEMYGDILFDETPTSIPDAIVLMKSVPRLLVDGNHGKGKPLSYTLLPIGLFRLLLSVESDFNSLVRLVDESTVGSCIRLFEEVSDVELRVNDMVAKMKIFQNYITTEEIQMINNFSNRYQLYQSELKVRLKDQLISVRSGDLKVDELAKILDEAYMHELSPINIDFDQFLSIEDELKFLKYLKSNLSVDILDKSTRFEEYMAMNYNKEIYAFFYSTDFPRLSENAMVEFRKKLDSGDFVDSGVFIAIKIDVLRADERETYFNFNESSRLRMFKHGRMEVDGYFVETGEPCRFSLDPLEIEHISLNKLEWLGWFSWLGTQLHNISFIGISDFIIKDLNFNLIGFNLSLQFVVPALEISGHHVSNGSILGLVPVIGSGPMNLTIRDLVFDIDGQLGFKNNTWFMARNEMNFTISAITGGFENLTDNFLNDLLNLNGPELLELHWPLLQPKVEGIVGNFLNDFSMEDLKCFLFEAGMD